MDVIRAFTYVFDDPQWIGKLVMVGLMVFLSVALMPLLGLGLVPLAVLLGYMMDIAVNVRDEAKYPLPIWDDYGGRMERGGNILVAVVVYNLPVLLLTCCISVIPSTFGGNVATSLVSLISLCCVLPVLVMYLAVAWPMLAAGIHRYSLSGRGEAMFKFGKLYDKTRAVGPYSLQLLLALIGVNMLFWLIPCVGWLMGAILAFPVFGHLTGQYARRIKATDKKARPA